MQIDNNTVAKVAHLARLKVDDIEKSIADLKKMISFIKKMDEVDTSEIEPLVYMNEEEGSLRDDEIIECASRTDALKNAPATDGNYFKVPKIIQISDEESVDLHQDL